MSAERSGKTPEEVIQHRCSTRVYGGSFSSHPCSKLGKAERNGKWYCGTHDPVRVAEKQAARSAKWDAERAETWRARDEANARQEALERDAALWRAHIAETQRSSSGEQTK